MNSTPELRTKLRKLINETVPQGKSDADTNFLDSEIDDLLKEAGNIYGAASAGWTIKAGLLQSQQTESYSVGQEKYDMTSLKDQLAHALAMAKQYGDMAKDGGTSSASGASSPTSGLILKLTRPEVL